MANNIDDTGSRNYDCIFFGGIDDDVDVCL